MQTDEIVVIENVEDMFNDTISALICTNTVTLYETLENINANCKDRCFNAYDIPIMQLTGVIHCKNKRVVSTP
jgi:hypothetical protein